MTFKEFLAISEGGDTSKTMISMKPAAPARAIPGPLGIIPHAKTNPVKPMKSPSGVINPNSMKK